MSNVRVMTKLEAECRASNTLTGALLRGGCSTDLSWGEITHGKLEDVQPLYAESISDAKEDAPTFKLVATPLPPLDTIDKIEDTLLVLGGPLESNGVKLYGIFNMPGTLSCKTDRMDSLWVNVQKLIRWAAEKKFYGPFALLHPEAWESKPSRYLDLEDIVQHVESIACRVASVKLNTPANHWAIAQLAPDVVQLIVMEDRIVPRIRADFKGNVGIVIAEG